MKKTNNKNRDNLEINNSVRAKSHAPLFLTLFVSLCAIFTISAASCDETPSIYEEGGTDSLLGDEDEGEESGDTETGGGTSEDENDHSITISDDIVGEWSSPQSGLSIFGDSVVAPGDKGTYTFYITNNSETDVSIDIDLSEANEFGVAFFYKLKDESNKYLVSEAYYPIEHTSDGSHFASNITISGGEKKTFILEWEWDDNYKDGEGDANDTAAGQSGKTDFYSLTIKVTGTYEDDSE